MWTDSDSFSSYIDHLILILAARFHAPLEVSAEDLLTTGVNLSTVAQSSWELVAQAVQEALRTPRTAQERAFVRHIDTHHFSASVCRERARYVQWQLLEGRRRSPDKGQASELTAGTTATSADTQSASSVTGRAVHPSDSATPSFLRKDISSIYALVRKSLPSTLGNSDSDDDGDVEVPVPTTRLAGSANASSPLASARDVFLRTPAEQERDELVARARDEFLTRVQELQSAYYEKYRRWMDVPSSVLDLPAAAIKGPIVNSDISASETEAAHRNAEGEGERAALMGILAAAPSQFPSQSAEANYINRRGVAERTEGSPKIASMLRQAQLRRPLRPSAVSDDLLESMYRACAESEEATKRWGSTNGSRSFALSASTATSPASAVASADAHFGKNSATALHSHQTSSAPSIPKETAPPVSRRGRWQTVEYDDVDDDDDDEG